MEVLQDFPAELTLKGFRGFKKETSLRLTHEDGKFANWTILLGENGTGKTSLLQALVAMWPGILTNRADGSGNRTTYKPDIVFFHREDFSIESSLPKPSFYSKIEFSNDTGRKPRTVTVESDVFGASQSISGGSVLKNDWSDKESIPLVCVYPSIFGILQQKSETSKDKILRNLIQFTDEGKSSDQKTTGFLRHPDNWFLDLHHSIKNVGTSKFSKIYEFAKSMICELAPGLHKIEVKFDNEGRSPKVVYQTELGPRYFHELSNGFQRIVVWLADFTSRMADYYSYLDGKWNEQPAMCLIDEIDQHLHPAWQRTILSKLAEKFPKTQFVATTHSPLIAQAVPDANFALLEKKVDDGGETYIEINNDPASIKGWRIDQIASTLFNSPHRDSETEAIYKEHSLLKQKKKLSTKEKKRLAEIDAELKNLPIWSDMKQEQAFEVLKRALEDAEAR